MSVNLLFFLFLFFLPVLEYCSNKQGGQRAKLNNTKKEGKKAVWS